MEITSIKYEIFPFGKFKQVYIFEEKGNFYIGLMTSRDISFIIFKNIIVGAFSYLNNKKEINKDVEYFNTIEECKTYLTDLTQQKFMRIFNKNRIIHSPYLLSQNNY